MDSDQLVSVVIGLVVFLFYTLKNKGQKKAGNKPVPAKTGNSAKAGKGSLQERLEIALREMQQRVEGEVSPVKTGKESSLEKSFAEVPGDEFDPTWASVKEKDLSSRLDDASSRFDTLEETTRSSDASGSFKQAHGLHYREEGDPYLKEQSDLPEFHEVHGLHYGEGARRPASGKPENSGAGALHDMLQNTDEVRRAVILAEVLGKPKALRA